jgi:hypothetical protein
VAGIRAGFWTGRVADLRGWMRRSPLLTVTFALIALASIGYPGLVAFDARTSIVNDTLTGPLATVVLIAVLAPIAYYGRLMVIGLLPPDRLVEPVNAWRPVVKRLDLTAVRPWLSATWDANRAFSTGAIAFVLAILALATAGGAFGGPAAAAEGPPVLADPNRIEVPVASGAPSLVSPAPAATDAPTGTPTEIPTEAPSANP